MRTFSLASAFVLALTFAAATPARAQSAPTSPCLTCCLLSLYCCTGTTPSVSSTLSWFDRFLSGNDGPEVQRDAEVVSADATPAPRDGLRAMAF